MSDWPQMGFTAKDAKDAKEIQKESDLCVDWGYKRTFLTLRSN